MDTGGTVRSKRAAPSPTGHMTIATATAIQMGISVVWRSETQRYARVRDPKFDS